MRKLFFALLFLMGCAFANPVFAGQETFLKRAVWSDGRVWLLSDHGQLFSVASDDIAPRFEYPGDKVLDMCASGKNLVVLVEQDDFPDPPQWQLRHREDLLWVDDISIPVERTKDGYVPEPLALVCDNDGLTMLTHDRLLTVRDGKIAGIVLKGKLGSGSTTVLSTPEKLYIGYNMGEWGGGLQSVDRISGAVKRIENKVGDLCEGLLNTDCDPVNGLALSPWHSGCIIASVGLQHMRSHGRVVEVCDSEIKQVYFKNYPVDGFGEETPPPFDPSIEGFSTIAFYGLAVEGKDVLAVGLNGLYHLHGDGTADFEPMPVFRRIAPFQFNFGRNDMVLVLTSITQRTAVSGATPILVPRH